MDFSHLQDFIVYFQLVLTVYLTTADYKKIRNEKQQNIRNSYSVSISVGHINNCIIFILLFF